MIPVLLGSGWEFLPSLDQKDAGVADVSTPDLNQTGETGSGRPKQRRTTRPLGRGYMLTANLSITENKDGLLGLLGTSRSTLTAFTCTYSDRAFRRGQRH